MKHTRYKTNKKIIDNLKIFYMYYQKYWKLHRGLKFSLKKDTNFNYSIFVNIIYTDSSPILHIINETTRFQVAR